MLTNENLFTLFQMKHDRKNFENEKNVMEIFFGMTGTFSI